MKIGQTRRVWLVALGVFVAVFLFTFLVAKFKNNEEVEAANLGAFDAGYIMSDYQMSNYNSMSESEIWNFLKQKGNCNDTRTYLASQYSSYSYHIKDGHFVCLADERFGDGETIGSGDTAAHIIWQAAQDYRINPQVLIVLLQKEQGLITDSWPNNRQYRSATGYGCPDTAACSSKYYGFRNQIRNAAALFRTVLDGGWTNYPLGNNYIQYNPNSGCGGSIVNVRSLATSALYRYTPYQPNAAALSAGYGTGDGCSAYGNRNFYSYFEDWFGGIKDNYSEKLGRTIPDGMYQIALKLDNDKVLDIYGGVYEGMKYEHIILFGAKEWGSSNQTFKVVYNEATGFYNILNEASGLYVDVDNGNVVVREKNSNCGQSWNIYRRESGYYNIISSCNGGKMIGDDNGVRVGSVGTSSSLAIWKMREISKETHSLKDGVYQIVSSISDERVLDVSAGDKKLELWSRKKSNEWMDNQLFEVKYDDYFGYYTIINSTSGLSLDVYKGFREDRTKIIAWDINNGCNQQWMIKESDSGEFEIISMCSGKNIDIYGGDAKVGQSIILYTGHNGKNQKWKFEDVPDADEFDGEYVIESKKDGRLVVDVSGGVSMKQASGEAIVYEKKNSKNENQIFVVERAEGDEYFIYNKTSWLYLDVSGGDTRNNARVIFWPFNGACNQRWKIKERDGFYMIASACNGKVLDVSRGAFVNGTPLIMYAEHGGMNQQWNFRAQ